jgi:hypothetical protein
MRVAIMSKCPQSLSAALFAALFLVNGLFHVVLSDVDGQLAELSLTYTVLTYSFAFGFAVLTWQFRTDEMAQARRLDERKAAPA